MSKNRSSLAGRRLLVARHIFQFGVERAQLGDEINRMLAIHGFHNSVESLLHAIAIEFDIRGESQLNVGFETLLRDIDKSTALANRGLRLPYRAEMRNLNTTRNLAMHHASAPNGGVLVEHQAIASSFLTKVVEEFFGLEFGSLDESSFVIDATLRKILVTAKQCATEDRWFACAALSVVAMRFAIRSVERSLQDPRRVGTFRDTSLRRVKGVDRDLMNGITDLCEQVDSMRRMITILASGASMADYLRLERLPLIVQLGIHGVASCRSSGTIADAEARWAQQFVVGQILRWQQLGLLTEVDGAFGESVDDWLRDFLGRKWPGEAA